MIAIAEYVLICDECGDRKWRDEMPSQEEYEDWEFDNDKHYCPECAEKRVKI